MIRSSFILAVSLLPAALAARSTDVSGTWRGADGPDGPTKFVYVLRASGDSLSGTLLLPEMEPVALRRGRLQGDSLFFDLELHGYVVSHRGRITGDTIRFVADMDRSLDVVMTRETP